MAKDGGVALSFQPLWDWSGSFLGVHGGQVADPMIEAENAMAFIPKSHVG